MGKGYCYECDENVEYVVKDARRRVTVRGVEVEADVKEVICKKCDNPILIHDIEFSNDISIYDEYKKKVGLMTTKELVENRKKLGMDQAEFAKYLGLSLKDIQRYEHGSIQSEVVDKVFKAKLMEGEKMKTEEARKYKCSVHSEDYGDGNVEFVSEFREFPNVIGAGNTEKEAIDEGYENLQVYLDYCKEEKIEYPKPLD